MSTQLGRALVLGGGGAVGIGWETGVLAGLRDGGADVTESLSPSPALVGPKLIAETAAIEAAGGRVLCIQPDAEALEQFGPDMMNAARAKDGADTGRRQGRSLAASVSAFWH